MRHAHEVGQEAIERNAVRKQAGTWARQRGTVVAGAVIAVGGVIGSFQYDDHFTGYLVGLFVALIPAIVIGGIVGAVTRARTMARFERERGES